MGNRAVTRVLANLESEDPNLAKKITAVILAAPDIDADVFTRDIAPKLTAQRPNYVTLYVSKSDEALNLSKSFHGYPRIGDASAGVPILAKICTIDASGVDTSFIGHSYYGENRSVLSDIYYVITETPPEKRFGIRVINTPEGKYWKLKD